MPLGQPGLQVTWEVSCDMQQLGIRQVDASHVSGQFFPIGRTDVTLTFADVDNFQRPCTFSVTVIEG